MTLDWCHDSGVHTGSLHAAKEVANRLRNTRSHRTVSTQVRQIDVAGFVNKLCVAAHM
ncbi:hypothetical protein RMSM_02503 [Rhodopirellula maiorica SM1]|uniref:Uncharacterized protein n=1 Tax=Rhodopirellula maiorica SM1 TaxID=1265738 RepID=M5S302_9BACT|nr:hypothetical protein RMSM_02503 [Rhodopirellula maiorica SM1]